MVDYDYALETASCHFGITAGTSRVDGAWEAAGHWQFLSGEREDGMRSRVTVSKRDGTLTALPCVKADRTGAPKSAQRVEVPWKYSPALV